MIHARRIKSVEGSKKRGKTKEKSGERLANKQCKILRKGELLVELVEG